MVWFSEGVVVMKINYRPPNPLSLVVCFLLLFWISFLFSPVSSSISFVPNVMNFSLLAFESGERGFVVERTYQRKKFPRLAVFLFHTTSSLELASIQFSALVDALQKGKVDLSDVSIEIWVQTNREREAVEKTLNLSTSKMMRPPPPQTFITTYPPSDTVHPSERHADIVNSAFQRRGGSYLLNNTAVLLLDGDMIPISPLSFSNLYLGDYPITCSSKSTYSQAPVQQRYFCWVGWILLFPELDETIIKNFSVSTGTGGDTGYETLQVTDIVGLNWMRKTRIPPKIRFVDGVLDQDIKWISKKSKYAHKCYFGQIYSVGDSHFYHMGSAASTWKFSQISMRYKDLQEKLNDKRISQFIIDDMKTVSSLAPELLGYPYGPCNHKFCCEVNDKKSLKIQRKKTDSADSEKTLN